MASPDDQRAEKIRALLRSRYDYLPDPVTSTGLIVRDSGVGPAAGKTVPCGLCLKSGYVIRRIEGRSQRRLCPLCEGSGWRRRRKGEDEWDEYLERPLRGSGKRAEPFRLADDLRRLSAQIERLEAEEAIRAGHFEGERYGWEAERRRMERAGSYQVLEEALARLRGERPTGYWVLHAFYWRELDFHPSDRLRSIEAETVDWLSRHLPSEIRVPAWLLDGQTQSKKRKTISELAQEGLSPGKIGFLLGMSRKSVKRALRKP